MKLFDRRSILASLLAFAPIYLLSGSNSPVLEDSPLKRLSTDFELADGPSWDGMALTVPDPFTEKATRYIPARDEWLPGLSGRRLSGSFYNLGATYFVDNGNAAILRLGKNNEVTVLHQEDLEADKTRKPNDLVVDRSGGVYFTMTKAGQVVYLPQGKPARVVTEDAATANGLILNPEESILYVSEAGSRRILAYDVGSEGKLSNRRVFATMEGSNPEAKGGADGMTMDIAGNVYSAGPEAIWIWAPDGKLLDKIPCPEHPVNCAFGGPDLRDLFIGAFGGIYLQKMKISGVPPSKP